MVQRNVLAMSGRAVEAAGDVHTLLLAGRLAAQRPVAVTVGTLRPHGVNFLVLASGAALVLALLNFLPALSLGPLADGVH